MNMHKAQSKAYCRKISSRLPLPRSHIIPLFPFQNYQRPRKNNKNSINFSLSLSSTMATATAPKVENPKNPTDLNLTPQATEDASSTQQSPSSGGDGNVTKGITEAEVEAVAVKTSDVDGGGAVTDIQKKMKRAERFGMAVHLSEEEKRNSRAERFGTGSALDGLDSLKQSEELKRKARAERFGTVQSVSADEEVKKKARIARFGSSSVTDSVEEDKKKARALRFSQPDTSPKANGKTNIEVKAAIAGKAGGGT